MKVLCKYSRNQDVPVRLRGGANLETAVFDLNVGREYVVHGQALFGTRLMYLIDPSENCRPNWYPTELFEVSDGAVPGGWMFMVFENEYFDDLGAIWGYEELVTDPHHFNSLVERDPNALAIFARQKFAERS